MSILLHVLLVGLVAATLTVGCSKKNRRSR